MLGQTAHHRESLPIVVQSDGGDNEHRTDQRHAYGQRYFTLALLAHGSKSTTAAEPSRIPARTPSVKESGTMTAKERRHCAVRSFAPRPQGISGPSMRGSDDFTSCLAARLRALQALQYLFSSVSDSLSPTPRLVFLLPLLHTSRPWARQRGRGTTAMHLKRLLASMTGSIDQELLLRNAYLVTEHPNEPVCLLVHAVP